jgi:hypothetical protein
MLRVVDRIADSGPIRRLDQALFGKRGKGMAKVTSGRAIEVSIEWGEDDDALTVADIIEFGERLKKGRTPRDAKAKVEWELVDGRDQYKLTVKGN